MSDLQSDYYFMHSGRKWRKTDPGIPATLKSELVGELMAARRAVQAALKGQDESALALARQRVNDAKVALGERGPQWWREMKPESLRTRLTASVKALLRHRDPASGICPSEAARVTAGVHWRAAMDDARQVALLLQAQGWLQIIQQGEQATLPLKGPIRLKRVRQ